MLTSPRVPIAAVLALCALVLAACGSEDPPSPAAASPEPTPQTEAPAPEFEPGHSAAVRRYYREPVGHAEDEGGDTEAEFRQPPRPASGSVGDTITLTGTNIGIRLEVTPTKVRDPAPSASRGAPAGRRYVAVDLRLKNTGITIFESGLRTAALGWGEDGSARPAVGVRAACSNGFDGILRIEPEAGARGCLVFAVPRSARPEELQLSLEQVPVAAGGRWRLG